MIADLVRNKKLEARLEAKTKEADEARKRAEESDKRAAELSARGRRSSPAVERAEGQRTELVPTAKSAWLKCTATPRIAEFQGLPAPLMTPVGAEKRSPARPWAATDCFRGPPAHYAAVRMSR